MPQPTIADKAPSLENLQKGKTYAWCACGKSSSQPWCNGSHKGSDISPKVFEAQATETKAICQCKQTSNPPFCDGTHSKL